MDNDEFVGRERELNTLSKLLKKKSASLVVLRGRRRVGKSRLAEEFAKGRRFFSFSGIPPTSGISKESQLEIFSQQLGKQLGIEGLNISDWSSLFSLLAQQTQKGEVVILLDEISWMGSKDPTFLGKLKNAWDLEFKKNPKLILILCGSVSTWIEKNIISSTAFFGRISLFLKLEEMPLPDSHKMLTIKKFRGSLYEKFMLLSVTGGIPWYLEQIDPKSTAEENIRNLCFTPSGTLFNEFDRIFNDLFEKRSVIYQPIVEALAHGAKEFNAICEYLDYSKSGTLSEYLDDLIKSGFVTRDFTWHIKSNQTSRLSKYRLSDNYLRFYLKYILPNKDSIIRGRFEEKSLSSLPGWNSALGFQFESLVLKNRKKIWEKLGIKPSDIVADNPYFQRATSGREGCQIDYLIQTRFHNLFVCEIKFSLRPIKLAAKKEVEDKIKKLITPKSYSCWPVLIHVNGVEESEYFSEILDFGSFLDNSLQ